VIYVKIGPKNYSIGTIYLEGERFMRSRSECERMLWDAVEQKAVLRLDFKDKRMSIKDNATVLRNYTALRGVIKTLRWVLDEIQETPLE
tara:strand:- start:994 stop:1260 length:267 start_codon:yes stop_codon:yes gene_type:complete